MIRYIRIAVCMSIAFAAVVAHAEIGRQPEAPHSFITAFAPERVTVRLEEGFNTKSAEHHQRALRYADWACRFYDRRAVFMWETDTPNQIGRGMGAMFLGSRDDQGIVRRSFTTESGNTLARGTLTYTYACANP